MTNEPVVAMQAAMESALTFCIEKMDLVDSDQVQAARSEENCPICANLRYGLAKGIAEYLGSNDHRAKAIYYYEEPNEALDWPDHCAGRPNLTPGICLIIWVSRKSPALTALIDSIAMAVDEESRRFYCPKANAMCHQLDAIVVDDSEVERRTGYGALLNSPYLRPVELWHG